MQPSPSEIPDDIATPQQKEARAQHEALSAIAACLEHPQKIIELHGIHRVYRWTDARGVSVQNDPLSIVRLATLQTGHVIVMFQPQARPQKAMLGLLTPDKVNGFHVDELLSGNLTSGDLQELPLRTLFLEIPLHDVIIAALHLKEFWKEAHELDA